MNQLLRITPKDNVAVALEPLSKGQTAQAEGFSLTLATDVPAGHKAALTDIPAGAQVIKYGFPSAMRRKTSPPAAMCMCTTCTPCSPAS